MENFIFYAVPEPFVTKSFNWDLNLYTKFMKPFCPCYPIELE